MTGFVYAIVAGSRVKIGWSTNPRRRVQGLKTGSAGHCNLVGFVPGTKAQEAELHALLSPWRVRREWFRVDGPVAHFVRAVRGRFPLEPHRRIADHAIARYRARHNLTLSKFAARIGTTTSTISRMEWGKQNPSYALARKIIAATNGEINASDLLRHPRRRPQ